MEDETTDIVDHCDILLSCVDSHDALADSSSALVSKPFHLCKRDAVARRPGSGRQGQVSHRRINKTGKLGIILKSESNFGEEVKKKSTNGPKVKEQISSPQKTIKPSKQWNLANDEDITSDMWPDESTNWAPSSELGSPRRKSVLSRSSVTTPMRPTHPILNLDEEDGYEKEQKDKLQMNPKNTPLSSPRRQLTFSSPSKTPKGKLKAQDPTIFQLPRNIKLNPNFVPTPIPKGYRLPEDRNLTYFFDGFEGYIDQKKPIRAHKKSRNSMSTAPSVSKDEFSMLSTVLNSFMNKSPREALTRLQQALFPQYWFELLQGFTLLFYGIGSKRRFLETFVFDYLSPKLALQYYEQEEAETTQTSDEEIEGLPCVVINGFNPSCNYRDCFQSIASVMLSEELSISETKYWNNHVHLQIQKMIEFWANESPEIRLIVLVHNLDGAMLRKDAFQVMLSSLAKIRQIAIVASIDNINAPLLWDNLRSQMYNFIFHDITNYENYSLEANFKSYIKLHKSELQASGVDAAKYVLESLTINSKRLFKLLLQTVIQSMESTKRIKITDSRRAGIAFGVLFNTFYQQCTFQFIASNEMSLRSMLSEFIEHKMAHMSKDKAGQETIYVSYSFGEMKKLLLEGLSDV
ncbi:origin recognition complex subunit 2 Ecym_2651 [Eremothecium cymbalariae DBVPG|uniref:Origin recognition complex subunit 2 n=1 Tax=Eremothecium cymbalariae (strain CBS 270.75 / DBVPG 7215 / KCTC 17166 / NRRL Y-17582) TaxID=931890 RepID=G8JNT7_ERECY|nr:Hypothetical protein Ecym_2651 [Eremothecium cymbalariae DBVPG\